MPQHNTLDAVDQQLADQLAKRARTRQQISDHLAQVARLRTEHATLTTGIDRLLERRQELAAAHEDRQ